MEGRGGGGSCVVKISGLIIIKDFTPCATVVIKVGTKITGGEGRESIHNASVLLPNDLFVKVGSHMS